MFDFSRIGLPIPLNQGIKEGSNRAKLYHGSCPYCNKFVAATQKQELMFGEDLLKIRKNAFGVISISLYECTSCNSIFTVLNFSKLITKKDSGIYKGKYAMYSIRSASPDDIELPCQVIYPYPQDVVTTLMEDLKNIPKEIFSDYYDANMCISVNLPSAAALLMRRALQRICRAFGIKKQNLKQEIEELAQLGRISNETSKLADGIRLVGNDVAHPDPSVDEPTIDDIEDARSFLEQVFQEVYILPAKRKELESRTNKRKTP